MRQLGRIEHERGLDKIFAEGGKGGIWSVFTCQRLKPSYSHLFGTPEGVP